jgi:hypothetical protein
MIALLGSGQLASCICLRYRFPVIGAKCQIRRQMPSRFDRDLTRLRTDARLTLPDTIHSTKYVSETQCQQLAARDNYSKERECFIFKYTNEHSSSSPEYFDDHLWRRGKGPVRENV